MSEPCLSNNGLNELINDIGSYIDMASTNSYDYFVDNLVKTKKLLVLSANNSVNKNASTTSLSSSAADKYLKSALNNLSDFMSEMEMNRVGNIGTLYNKHLYMWREPDIITLIADIYSTNLNKKRKRYGT